MVQLSLSFFLGVSPHNTTRGGGCVEKAPFDYKMKRNSTWQPIPRVTEERAVTCSPGQIPGVRWLR